MTITITRDGTPVANSDTTQKYSGYSVTPGTVFVITFSDGSQIAITNYDDNEANDIQLGTPTPSGTTDTVNLYMWSINEPLPGARFDVHAYSGGTLGDLLYSFGNTDATDATIQFTFETASNTLTITTAFDDPTLRPIYDGTIPGYSGTEVFSTPACYLAGTRILTGHGPVAIEALRPGDPVATRTGGLRPVRWIATQTLLALGARGMVAPVCIRAGALGENQPAHDLWVSPGHAVLVGEHLVCAYLLLNGTSIVQPPHTGEIRYLHIDLGTHDCVLAEGAWAESYYEHFNRDRFDNAAEFRARFPEAAPQHQATCLPYVNRPDHPDLPALRSHVEARAPRPEAPHLLADGAILYPEPGAPPHAWRFAIPAGTATLRLRSPAASPAEAFGRKDIRRLGLRLRAAVLDHEGTRTALDLADPGLSDGWHQPEDAHGTLWRWTDGDAALPFATRGAAMLTLSGYALLEAPLPARQAA